MLAECLGVEASFAHLDQRSDSRAMAARALAVCRSLGPVPVTAEARLLGIVATAHVANLDWDKAVEIYGEAIEAAGSFGDLKLLASMYRGLSSSYKQLGQMDSAARYATRSVALLEVLRDRVALARAEHNLGLILLAPGHTAPV